MAIPNMEKRLTRWELRKKQKDNLNISNVSRTESGQNVGVRPHSGHSLPDSGQRKIWTSKYIREFRIKVILKIIF